GEDGIRDFHVTGVQTCALPICAGVKSAAVAGQGIFRDAASDALIREAFFDQSARTWRLVVPDFGVLEGPFLVSALEYAGEHEGRSEERRVGKARACGQGVTRHE